MTDRPSMDLPDPLSPTIASVSPRCSVSDTSRTGRIGPAGVSMAIVRPCRVPRRRRMVSASSSACVGCSWVPSPALITAASTLRASSAGAPDWPWRTTSRSQCMAFSVVAVSSRVSPLFTDELDTDMLMTSAPNRLPASSKEVRVRVLSSKNRLIRVRPRSASRWVWRERLSSTWLSASSSSSTTVRGGRPSTPSRCRSNWWWS